MDSEDGSAMPAQTNNAEQDGVSNRGTKATSKPGSLKRAHQDIDLLAGWARDVDSRILLDIDRRLKDLEAARDSAPEQVAHRIFGEMLAFIKGYTTLVLAIGFGGIITIWSQSQAVMLPAAFAGAGAAVILSLLLFIGSEIAQTRIMVNALKVPLDRLEEESQAGAKRASVIGHALYWPILLLGMGGGMTIFLCYAGALINAAGASGRA